METTATFLGLLSDGKVSHDGDEVLRGQAILGRMRESVTGAYFEPSAETQGLIAVVMAARRRRAQACPEDPRLEGCLMGLWSWLTGVNHQGDIPNANPPSSVGSGQGDGDPHGFEVEGEETQSRALPAWHPSPWAGWPAEWSTPNWDMGSRFNELVDVAWRCLDINASVLSAMPVYRTSGGRIVESSSWMVNPDPRIYTSWAEFAQLFWDFQMGEAFIMRVDSFQ